MSAAPTKVKALADFKGTEAGELSFKEGEVFVLLEKGRSAVGAPANALLTLAHTDQSGWAKGLLNDKKGWFPWDYVEQLPAEAVAVATPASPPAGEVWWWWCWVVGGGWWVVGGGWWWCGGVGCGV